MLRVLGCESHRRAWSSNLIIVLFPDCCFKCLIGFAYCSDHIIYKLAEESQAHKKMKMLYIYKVVIASCQYNLWCGKVY